jgi:dienelactone hydrolase
VRALFSLIVALLGGTACNACNARDVVAVPASTPSVRSESKRSAEIARALVSAFARRDFEAGRRDFDERLGGAFTSDKIAGVWNKLEQDSGTFERIVETRAEYTAPFLTEHVIARFAREELDLRVTFRADGKVSGFHISPAADAPAEWAPPDYVVASSFSEESLDVGGTGTSVPGTLTLPKGAGPWPAVVLVHGSGPGDRDESLRSTRIFRDLAWGLGSRGIAVLRYEKRTRARKAEVAAREGTFTIDDEYLVDACAASSLLSIRSGIDARAIFFLGHSLGGRMLPRIAAKCSPVAGLIGLAAPTEPIDRTLERQAEYLGHLPENHNARARATLDRLKHTAEILREPDYATKYQNEKIDCCYPTYWKSQLAVLPAEEAKQIAQPILLLQGERDYQVLPADLGPWREALGSTGRLTVKMYSKLDHYFVEGEGKSTPAEYAKPGRHVARYVVDDVAAWVRERSTR